MVPVRVESDTSLEKQLEHNAIHIADVGKNIGAYNLNATDRHAKKEIKNRMPKHSSEVSECKAGHAKQKETMALAQQVTNGRKINLQGRLGTKVNIAGDVKLQKR